MKLFYDCEFLEDGRTIDLISIGMVRECGAEYYAVNRDMPVRRIRRNPWLMANVVPSLPRAPGDARLYQPKRWLFNYSDPCVKSRQVIAREVREFILAADRPELWAWYAAYDHVLLCQLWGRMIDLPEGMPMWTNDLKQEAERLGNPDVPRLSGVGPGMSKHNALHDAREVKYRYDWLVARGRDNNTGVTGLDKVQEAARRSRGGEPPVQARGFA